MIPSYATAQVPVVNAFGSLYGTWDLVSDDSIGATRRMALLVQEAHEFLPQPVNGIVTLHNGAKRVAKQHIGFLTGQTYLNYFTPGRQWRMADEAVAQTFIPD